MNVCEIAERPVVFADRPEIITQSPIIAVVGKACFDIGHAPRRLAPALRRAGFNYQRPEREAKRRIIVLVKKCKDGKTTSETSQTSFAKENPEKATSSQNVTESATSSQVPKGNDDHDDHDDIFPTSHDRDKRSQEPSAGAPIEPDAVDL